MKNQSVYGVSTKHSNTVWPERTVVEC